MFSCGARYLARSLLLLLITVFIASLVVLFHLLADRSIASSNELLRPSTQ
jgi:hypothetical protein